RRARHRASTVTGGDLTTEARRSRRKASLPLRDLRVSVVKRLSRAAGDVGGEGGAGGGGGEVVPGDRLRGEEADGERFVAGGGRAGEQVRVVDDEDDG